MATKKSAVRKKVKVNADTKKLYLLQSITENALTPIMMIDSDFVITYANKSTIVLLQKYEETLKSLYPGFSANNLIGTCIDIFHANPAHQRKLLGNPNNLPYSTDIEVGPLVFRLGVTALTDETGGYVGLQSGMVRYNRGQARAY